MTACRITLNDKDLVHYCAFHRISSYKISVLLSEKFESLDLPLLDQVELNKNDAERKTDKLMNFS